MAYDYSKLLFEIQSWAEKQLAAGYVCKHTVQTLFEKDIAMTDPLFYSEQEKNRPLLIVAFLGGSGVGKSSLLNRLAGENIAKTGVQRPTSREVTVYHHQSVTIQQLPDFPINSYQIYTHNNAENAHIVWIDMPDFDSIELANHERVIEWLPNIDVLIYVVSPERYRDNKIWQLLISEALKHAWLFVMNQWDRGQDQQFEDFKRQLLKAGFNQPLAYKTCCSEPIADEFAELFQQIQVLARATNVEQLHARQSQLHAQQLKHSLQAIQAELQAADFEKLLNFHAAQWQKNEKNLIEGIIWLLSQLARAWVEHPGQKVDLVVWDDWAQSRLDDLVDELVVQSVAFNIASKPLKTALHTFKLKAARIITHNTEQAGRHALSNPGNNVQRLALKTTAVLETIMPLMAMGFVGFHLYQSYTITSALNPSNMGLDFAIQSVLLIAISWLMPYFLNKKLQPSLEKSAFKGLKQGMQRSLVLLDEEIKTILATEQNHNLELQANLKDFIQATEKSSKFVPPQNSLLNSVLGNEPPFNP